MSKVAIGLVCVLGIGVSLASCASPRGEGRDDAGRRDAGAHDAALHDAAPEDAARDAQPLDAQPLDAARSDAGPGDACGNGLDDDRDGTIDEGCACELDATQPCYRGDPALAGIGGCVLGTQRCGGSELPSWGVCEGSGAPVDERCGDGVDDDCDGTVDEGCGGPCEPTFLGWPISAEEMRTGASDTTGPGECSGTVYFSGTTGTTTPPAGCGSPHCGTLRYGDGRTRAMYCTVRATCTDGTAVATGFGW